MCEYLFYLQNPEIAMQGTAHYTGYYFYPEGLLGKADKIVEYL